MVHGGPMDDRRKASQAGPSASGQGEDAPGPEERRPTTTGGGVQGSSHDLSTQAPGTLRPTGRIGRGVGDIDEEIETSLPPGEVDDAPPRYLLQVLDSSGHWRDWQPILGGGLVIGRSRGGPALPASGSMAVRHLRLAYVQGNLFAEDLGSLNGLYQRITKPVRLHDGARFRVGNQVLEFHNAGPHHPVPPFHSADGEEFCSRDLEPLAYLDAIRPDGRPGSRFPITRKDATVIGREGPTVAIALTGDQWVSAPHAQIRLEDQGFYLEDLRSRNGTFFQIQGPTPLTEGDVLLAGRVLLRIVAGQANQGLS